MDLPVNAFKRGLLAGQTQIGLWSHLCSPIATEILSRCGYDWLLLDMEHSPNDLSEILAQLHAMQGGSAAAVVRPPWLDMVLFKRLLDIGVQNLLVPYIQTEEEAQRGGLHALPAARRARLCRRPPREPVRPRQGLCQALRRGDRRHGAGRDGAGPAEPGGHCPR